MTVLFVCNGNSARSQEAEAFFNHVDQRDVAISGGTDVILGKPIDPLAVQVMAEAGIDVSGAQRKSVTAEMAAQAARIISFKPLNELPDFLAKSDKIEVWEIADPRGQSPGFHRQTRDAIKRRIDDAFKTS